MARPPARLPSLVRLDGRGANEHVQPIEYRSARPPPQETEESPLAFSNRVYDIYDNAPVILDAVNQHLFALWEATGKPFDKTAVARMVAIDIKAGLTPDSARIIATFRDLCSLQNLPGGTGWTMAAACTGAKLLHRAKSTFSGFTRKLYTPADAQEDFEFIGDVYTIDIVATLSVVDVEGKRTLRISVEPYTRLDQALISKVLDVLRLLKILPFDVEVESLVSTEEDQRR
jgi:hypothetical protein